MDEGNKPGEGAADSNTIGKRKGPLRLRKKLLLFQLASHEPELSATDLRNRASMLGLDLSLSSAYRTLAKVDKYKTVENSEVRCLRAVSEVLQESPAGEHLSAREIHDRILKQDTRLHISTTYRVLERLSHVGMVSVVRKGRQNFYEWRSKDQPHGHLVCLDCGTTIEFTQESLDDFARKICDRTGYEFAYMEFLIRSICEKCKSV